MHFKILWEAWMIIIEHLNCVSFNNSFLTDLNIACDCVHQFIWIGACVIKRLPIRGVKTVSKLLPSIIRPLISRFQEKFITPDFLSICWEEMDDIMIGTSNKNFRPQLLEWEWGAFTYCCRLGRWGESWNVLESPKIKTGWSADQESAALRHVNYNFCSVLINSGLGYKQQ